MQLLPELNSINQLSRKKRDKTLLLPKTKLNYVEVFISKTLIDSYISHDEFILVNNLLREYNEMKEEIKSMVDISIETYEKWCRNNSI